MAIVKKVSVQLPKELIERIRDLVPEGEVSDFVEEAIRFYVAMQRQKAAIEAGFGAWGAEDHPELATPDDTVRRVRELRERDRLK